MKKFIAIFLMFSLTLAAVSIQAQTLVTQTSTAGASKTTHTDADTSYHTIDLAGSTNNFAILNFVLKGTKTSGTVGGSAILYASMDNSRWFHVTPDAGSDTATLANGDNNFYWKFTGATGSGAHWRYYRLIVKTSGTQVSTYQVRMLGRKVAN